MTTETNGAVLLDDGEYFVQHNVDCPPTVGNGFLMRRCHSGQTTSDGADCVGGYDLKLDGRWLVDIATHYDAETDAGYRVPGQFDSRLDAIHALWQHRHEAANRHPRH